jgi:hypothetical protein
MNLYKIELGDSRSAFIREEISVGQVEDMAFLEAQWVPTAPETRKNTYSMSPPIITCVERFEGYDDDWPDLDSELDVDNQSVAARYNWIRKNLGLRSIMDLCATIAERANPSEKLEGN